MSLYSIQALQGLSSGSLQLASASLATLHRPQLIARLDRAESLLHGESFSITQANEFNRQLLPLVNLQLGCIDRAIDVDTVRAAAREASALSIQLVQAETSPQYGKTYVAIIGQLARARRAIVPSFIYPEIAAETGSSEAEESYVVRLTQGADTWLNGDHLLPRLGPYDFGPHPLGQERLKLFFQLPKQVTRCDLLVRLYAAHAVQRYLRGLIAKNDVEQLKAMAWPEFVAEWSHYGRALSAPDCDDLGEMTLQIIWEGKALYTELMTIDSRDEPIKMEARPAVSFRWDAQVLQLHERRLSEFFQPPHQFSEVNSLIRAVVAAAVQQDVMQRITEANQAQGGVFSKELYAELDGLTYPISFMWLTHRRGTTTPFRSGRSSAAERMVRSHVRWGVDMPALLERGLNRTRLVGIVERAQREHTPQALAALVQALPHVVTEMMAIDKEYQNSTSRQEREGLKYVWRHLLRWVFALKPWRFHETLRDVDANDAVTLRGTLSQIDSFRQSKLYDDWVTQLPDNLPESVPQRFETFHQDAELRALLDPERLALIRTIPVLLEQGHQRAGLMERFPPRADEDNRFVVSPEQSGFRNTVLTVIDGDDGAVALYQRLLRGDDSIASGPLAHALASQRGRWHRLFGIRALRKKFEVWPVITEVDGRINIDNVVLYEHGQPVATLFPLWRGLDGEQDASVPLLFHLKVERAAKENRNLHLQLLDYSGRRVESVSFQPRQLPLGSRHLLEGHFLSHDTAGMRVGVLESQQRRRLYVQGDKAEGFVLALPRYDADSARTMAQIVEDLVALAPLARGPFRRFIEQQFIATFEEAAQRNPGDPERQALIRVTSRSPYPMLGRLLRFLRPHTRWTPEVQDLAAEIEFLRPMEARGYDIPEVVQLSPKLRRAVVKDMKRVEGDRRYAQCHYHYIVHRETLEDAYRTILAQVKDDSRTISDDRTIKIIVPDKIFSGSVRMARGPTSREDPIQDRAAHLNNVFNSIVESPEWDSIRDRVWRLTFVIDRGRGNRPQYVTLRNRVRYDQEKFRLGYHITLPGERSFAVDPALLGIDPAFGHRYGLQRLGNYRHIDYVQPFEVKTALILRLHSSQSDQTSLYMASYLLAPDDALVSKHGRMPGLLRRHRRMSEELHRQLETGEVSQWQRMRIYVEGVQYQTPAVWEELMAAFARESSYDRAGIDLEQLVIQARLEVSLDERMPPRRVTALTFISDTDIGSPLVSVRYIVSAETPSGRRWVLVRRNVLERMLRTGNIHLSPDDDYRDAEEQMEDKSPIDKRRTLAKNLGGVFVYDRVQRLLPEAYEKLWEDVGSPAPPLDMDAIREMYIDDEGLFRIGRRPAGLNPTGVAAFQVRLKLPNHPEGITCVVIGNDPTHPVAKRAAVDIESAKFFWLAMEYARQQGYPPIYLAETPGAQMALPHALIPRHPGQPARLSSDETGEDIYLTAKQVEAVVRALGAASWQEVFKGDWEGAEGQSNFRPCSLLQGGVNQKSLLGSGLTAGAMARAAAEVPTFSAVLGGKGRGRNRVTVVGIGMYLYILARAMRIQRGDPNNELREDEMSAAERALLDGAVMLLTGADAINNIFGQALFFDTIELGGANRMKAEGLTTQVAHSEVDALLAVLKGLDDPANQTIPDITQPYSWEQLSEIVSEVRPFTPRGSNDINARIEASVTRVNQERKELGLPVDPQSGNYDVADELEALFDAGTFNRISDTDHYAIAGMARMSGFPVAGVGAQMIMEFPRDEAGDIQYIDREVYDADGNKLTRKDLNWNPPMTLSPRGAGDLASFIEFMTQHFPWVPIVGDLAASGYDPRSVAGSGQNGARLLSAIVNHPAPVYLWAGPRKKVLGGMKVTVAKELGMKLKVPLEDGTEVDLRKLETLADAGHIKVYADPSSYEAVLDAKGWKGIGFYKATVRQMTHILIEQGRPESEAGILAEKMVDTVIGWMSTLERAEADGSFTAVVSADRIRGVITQELKSWYESEAYERLRSAATPSQ